MPCGELPVGWAVVPFAEERTAGGDISVLVAAVVDDDIDAAAFTLPFIDTNTGEAAFAACVVCFLGIFSVVERPQAYLTGRLAQGMDKLPAEVKINVLHACSL